MKYTINLNADQELGLADVVDDVNSKKDPKTPDVTNEEWLQTRLNGELESAINSVNSQKREILLDKYSKASAQDRADVDAKLGI